MEIRNKQTGRIHEVMEGTLYSKEIFEEVKDEDIIVGEPKVEYEIEETKEEEPVLKKTKKSVKTGKKPVKKGAKKNGGPKTKSN